MITIPLWLFVILACLSIREIIMQVCRLVRKSIVEHKNKRHNVISEGVNFKRKR